MRNRNEIRLGEFVFDPKTRDLRDGDGRHVELRKKSSEVLAFLATQPGAIVGKSDIMDVVWPDVFVSDDSLTQCIGDIRRAICDKDQSIIKTHVGKGYSLAIGVKSAGSEHPGMNASRLALPTLATLAFLVSAIAAAYFGVFDPAEDVLGVGTAADHEPDKNSIAVLPFENMSGDPEDDWFVDGMTADITTDLSQISGLFVTARNSSFVYRDRHHSVREISEELGVRYLLEGSVQRSSDQIRIRASLVDGISGRQLWSERFDEPRKSVFELQDRITNRVVQALSVQLTSQEQLGTPLDTESARAYEAFLRGREHLRHDTPEDLAAARDFFEKSVELDPDYGRAHAALALVYYRAFERGWNRPLGINWNVARLRTGRHMTEAWKAPTSLAYRVSSEILLRVARTEEALDDARQAMALDPNDPENQVAVALSLIYLGRNDDAISLVDAAMRRDIHFPARYLYVRGLAKFGVEDYAGAEADLTASIARNPENHRAHAVLAAAFAYLDRIPEAKNHFELYREAERQDSHTAKMSDHSIYQRWPYKHEEDWRRFAEGLAAASGKPIQSTHLGDDSFFEFVFSE